ncbi:MAG TPA: alpha/beta fold hydrolase [Candidatus Tectomicrobia bacterium]
MSVTPDHSNELMQIADVSIQVLKGGEGEPLLLLHGAGGNPGWLSYHQALAQRFTVYAPSHPGYDRSSRPDWNQYHERHGALLSAIH